MESLYCNVVGDVHNFNSVIICGMYYDYVKLFISDFVLFHFISCEISRIVKTLLSLLIKTTWKTPLLLDSVINIYVHKSKYFNIIRGDMVSMFMQKFS